MTRQLWLPSTGMFCCAILSAWLFGQEPPAVDPFSEAKVAAPEAAPAAPKKKEAPVKTETDPLVLDILASKPASAEAILQAATNLINYGRPDAAKVFVTQLFQSKPDDETSWQLQRKFGSGVFYRLAIREDLQPEGKQLADHVLDGANRFVRQPARIELLIKRLSHVQPESRHAAFVDLKEADFLAASAIIKSLQDPARTAEHPVLQATLVRLGSLSVGPALATLQSPDPNLRSAMIVVLGQLQTAESLPFLFRPYFTLPQDSAEHRAAAAALTRLVGKLPQKSEAERKLFRAVTESFGGRLPTKSDHENKVDVWQWDFATRQPVRAKVDASIAPILLAAQLTSELVAIAPNNRDYQRWHLAAMLDAAKLTSGWEQPLRPGAGTAFAKAAEYRELWDEGLRFSLENGHLAAAVGLLEVIGQAGDQTMVHSSGGQPRELVRALRHSSRRVRFAALQAVMQLAPQAPFAGASYVPEALGYFARTSGSRRALIAHPRIGQSQTLAGILRDSGFESELSDQGLTALQYAQRSSDFEFALLSDGLDRPNVQELVGQFRREPRTARLPIGILALPENFDRLRRALVDDPLTEVFAYPNDVPGVSFVLRRLLERLERGWVGQDERMRQAALSLDWFATLAARKQQFEFYELLPQQAAVELALTVPQLAAKASRVLGLLGSQDAQRALVSLVNQTGRPLPERQAAAAAFESAVQRRGVLLESSEILRQFDIYNSSANADAGTQQVFNAILNTIEGVPNTPTAPPSDATP